MIFVWIRVMRYRITNRIRPASPTVAGEQPFSSDMAREAVDGMRQASVNRIPGAMPEGFGGFAQGLAAAAEAQRQQLRETAYGSQEGPGIIWPCINSAGLCDHLSVCSFTGHCTEEPRVSESQPWRTVHEEYLRLGGVASTEKIQSSESLSGEIFLCSACPHPEHVTGDRRCAAQVPSGGSSGGIEQCRCGQSMSDAQDEVARGFLTPVEFREVWHCWPRFTYETHQMWCGKNHRRPGNPNDWSACTDWKV